VRESEGLVQPDRRDIGLIHVKHDLEQAAGAQVAKPDHGQRAAEAGAALGGIDPDDINLADRLMAVIRLPAAGVSRPFLALGSRLFRAVSDDLAWAMMTWRFPGGLAWARVPRRLLGATMDLGPVKPDDLPPALSQEEAVRVEPWFPFALVQVHAGPSALLRMTGEGLAVDREPLVLIAADPEGADGDAVRKLGAAEPGLQRAPHLPQCPDPAETRRGREPGRGRQIAVRP